MKLNKYIVAGLIGLSLVVNNTVNAQFSTPGLQVATNITTITQTNIVLLTNSSKISRVQVLAGAVGLTVSVYDNNVTNQTYTNAAFTNRVEYVTNVVNSTVSPFTGVTNTYTNSMLWVTNAVFAAATNNLTPYLFPAQANTLATYDVNLLNSKGIMITASTNASVIITYRLNE